MQHLKLLFAVGFLLNISACTHSVHDVYVGDYGPKTNVEIDKLIEAHTEQFVIMGFTTDTVYVDDAYHKLQDQCSGKRVGGITTEYWTSHGFFSWTNKVRMQGYCPNGLVE